MKKLISWIHWKIRYLRGVPQQKAICHAFKANVELEKAIKRLENCTCEDCISIRRGYEIANDALCFVIKKYLEDKK